MLQLKHSAILLAFIKLPFFIKIFCHFSIFERPFYTGFFTVHGPAHGIYILNTYMYAQMPQINVHADTSAWTFIRGICAYAFRRLITAQSPRFIRWMQKDSEFGYNHSLGLSLSCALGVKKGNIHVQWMPV